MSDASGCTCGRIMLGSKPSGARNWNPDCPEHGIESDWWQSPEQVARRQEQSSRLRDLQRQAAEARRRASEP